VLNVGVSAPEIARRAGHGVEVLLRVYAGCIDGQDAVAIQLLAGRHMWCPVPQARQRLGVVAFR
jgi:hypothetical protein